MKIVIMVSGGCVQSVQGLDIPKGLKLDVEVLDCDGDQRDENEAKCEEISNDPAWKGLWG